MPNYEQDTFGPNTQQRDSSRGQRGSPRDFEQAQQRGGRDEQRRQASDSYYGRERNDRDEDRYGEERFPQSQAERDQWRSPDERGSYGSRENRGEQRYGEQRYGEQRYGEQRYGDAGRGFGSSESFGRGGYEQGGSRGAGGYSEGRAFGGSSDYGQREGSFGSREGYRVSSGGGSNYGSFGRADQDERRQGNGGSSYGGASYGGASYGSPTYGDSNYGGTNYRDANGGSSYGPASYGDSRSSWRQGGMSSSSTSESQQSFRGKGPKGYSRPDARIKEDLEQRLTDDHQIDASEIECTVKNGEVTLTGTVSSRQMKEWAEDVAEAISGVKDVQNNLRVQRSKGGDRNEQDRASTDMHASGSQSSGSQSGGSQSSSGSKREESSGSRKS